MQAFGEEGDQVILEVHADILGLGIQDVSLLLSEDLNVVLGVRLFLLLNYLLEVLLLLSHRHFLDSDSSLGCFVLLASLRFLILVERHIVVRSLVPFDVDLEAIEGVLGACAD